MSAPGGLKLQLRPSWPPFFLQLTQEFARFIKMRSGKNRKSENPCFFTFSTKRLDGIFSQNCLNGRNKSGE